MNKTELEYIFTHLGFLIRGYLMRLGLTQGLWQEFRSAAEQSIANNLWFTQQSIQQALAAIAEDMLAPQKLSAWLARYPCNVKKCKNVGIVMAGNLPLVGFHDMLCVLCNGHTAVIKLSHKDPFLLPMLAQQMVKINYRIANKIIFADNIGTQIDAQIDAVIATGSDNTAVAMEKKYGHIPHIFRRSKHSVGVLCGSENVEQLRGLAHDMLDYFGLGCRSVSKVFVHRDYDFSALQEILSAFTIDNQNFINAYRYVRALNIAQGKTIIDCGCCVLQENDGHFPTAAQVFFEYYIDENDLQKKLSNQQNRLQCLVSERPIDNFERLHTPFGTTQRPQLCDYADGTDVMEWLQR
jgi:hypothetical protein